MTRSNSSPEVKIDFSKTFAGVAVPPNFTNVIIDNVRIIDDNDINYQIDGITAYEWREELDDWKEDVEFTMNYTQVQDLSVIMVLDESASLGEDFEKVKQYASSFITNVLAMRFQMPKLVSLILLTRSTVFPPTNNKAALIKIISPVCARSVYFTCMNQSISALICLEDMDAEAKVLLSLYRWYR